MNIFTTEHPLASQPSSVDAKEHPVRSFFWSAFVLALVLTPFVLVQLYYLVIGDVGAEPDPFPDPWLDLLLGIALAFAFSFLCALPAVFVCRRVARRVLGQRREAEGRGAELHSAVSPICNRQVW